MSKLENHTIKWKLIINHTNLQAPPILTSQKSTLVVIIDVDQKSI